MKQNNELKDPRPVNEPSSEHGESDWQPNVKKSNGSSGILTLVIVGIVLVFLVFVSLIVAAIIVLYGDVGEFIQVFLSLPVWVLPSIFVVFSSTLLFQALRWRAVIKSIHPGVNLSLFNLAGYICAGMMFNVALPGVGGELASSVFLKYRYRVPLAVGFAASIYSRVVALIILGVLGFVTLPFFYNNVSNTLIMYILYGAIALVAIVIAGMLLVSLRPAILQWAADVSIRLLEWIWRKKTSRLKNALRMHLTDLGHSGYICRSVLMKGASPFIFAAIYSIFIIILHITGLNLAAIGLGYYPSLPALGLLHSLSSFSLIANIIIPSGLGISEVTFFVLSKELLSLSQHTALLYFTVVRIGLTLYLLAALPIGCIVWRSLKKHGMSIEDISGAKKEFRVQITSKKEYLFSGEGIGK